MPETLLLPAHLQRYSRLKDGSVTITLVTSEEISNDGLAEIDQFWQTNGWLAFKRNKFDVSDLPQENARVEGQLTDSQYLRRCLFAKHMAVGGTKDSFPEYYHKVMRQFADAVNASFPEE